MEEAHNDRRLPGRCCSRVVVVDASGMHWAEEGAVVGCSSWQPRRRWPSCQMSTTSPCFSKALEVSIREWLVQSVPGVWSWALLGKDTEQCRTVKRKSSRDVATNPIKRCSVILFHRHRMLHKTQTAPVTGICTLMGGDVMGMKLRATPAKPCLSRRCLLHILDCRNMGNESSKWCASWKCFTVLI
jgi:hypothetical protein